MILTEDVRDVKISGLKTRQMRVLVDSQTVKNLVSNYSKPQEACIRELCVNAYESHLLAGKENDPFDVHMPTKLEPWFSVVDYGIGMSESEIWDLYASIGSSSKRKNNDLIGAFGVGGLSPYAITNMFSIQSNYNGQKFSYICHLDTQGIPCLSEAPNNGLPTSEKNGFTVKFDVPAAEYYKFKEALKPALKYFKVKPNITGCEVSWDTDEVVAEGQGYKVYKNARVSNVIMGQIGYPIDKYTVGSSIPYKFNFDIEVPIGAVDINSSRETLQYTSKTIQAVIAATNVMMKDIDSKIDTWIAKEDCLWNQCLKSAEFTNLFGTKTRYPPYFTSAPTTLNVRTFTLYGYSFSMKKLKTIKDYTDHGGARFVIDDLPRGAIARCQEIKKLYGDVVLIQKADEALAKKQFGLIDKYLINASDLPRPTITRQSRGVSKSKIQTLHFSNSITKCWKDSDTPLEKNALYCNISQHKTTLNNKECSPLELNSILQFIGLYEKVPTVYGVKKGGVPEKTWATVETFVNQKVKKYIQQYIDAANVHYVPLHEYNILKTIFDFSNFPLQTQGTSRYTTLLGQWFAVPKPTPAENKWGKLMDEMFFWDSFRYRMSDKRYVEAFKVLCREYVTTFKLKETK